MMGEFIDFGMKGVKALMADSPFIRTMLHFPETHI